MRIVDAQWIPSTQHQTWDALTDPDVLQRCIPNCVEVIQRTPTEYTVTLRAKIAGLDTDYDGEILMSDVAPPIAAPWSSRVRGAPRAWSSARRRSTSARRTKAPGSPIPSPAWPAASWRNAARACC